MVLASLVSSEAFLSGLQMAPFSLCPHMRHSLPSMPMSVAFVCIYLWLCRIFVAESGHPLVSASKDHSPVIRGLLAVASLVAELWL